MYESRRARYYSLVALTNHQEKRHDSTAEKKPMITLEKKDSMTDTANPSVDAAPASTTTAPEKTTIENLRVAIKALDAKRTELVKNTIENVKP